MRVDTVAIAAAFDGNHVAARSCADCRRGFDTRMFHSRTGFMSSGCVSCRLAILGLTDHLVHLRITPDKYQQMANHFETLVRSQTLDGMRVLQSSACRPLWDHACMALTLYI